MRDLAIAVTGSRDWTNVEAITAALSALEPWIAVVIEGRQRGADRIAGRWASEARQRGVGWVPFYADWQRYGRRAGPMRNAAMVEYLNQCRAIGLAPYYLAFPLEHSVGTWEMVDRCKAAGIKGMICA